jgi:hypothetical protein
MFFDEGLPHTNNALHGLVFLEAAGRGANTMVIGTATAGRNIREV